MAQIHIEKMLDSVRSTLGTSRTCVACPRIPLYIIIIGNALPFPNNEDRGLGIDPRPLHFQHMMWVLEVTWQTLQPLPSGVLPKPWHAEHDLISGVAPRP